MKPTRKAATVKAVKRNQTNQGVKTMKRFAIAACVLMLAGCGYSSRNNEMVGQAKRIIHVTPLVCSDYTVFDLSLGVMRNGSGSMSTQDIMFYVERDDEATMAKIKRLVDTGAIVKVRYDERRLAFCAPHHWLLAIDEIVQ